MRLCVDYRNSGIMDSIIKILGIGNAGIHILQKFMFGHGETTNLESIAIIRNAQHHKISKAHRKIQIDLVNKRGFGLDISAFSQGVKQKRKLIKEVIKGTDLVIAITRAGGRSALGVTPVVVSIAKELGVLIVVIATLLFLFEGKRREKASQKALSVLRRCCDYVIFFANQRLFKKNDRDTTLGVIFRQVDEVVSGVVWALVATLLDSDYCFVNLELQNLKDILSKGNTLDIGIGFGRGDSAGEDAATEAMRLFEGHRVEDGKGAIVLFEVGSDIRLFDIDAAMTSIEKLMDKEALIDFGITIHEKQKDLMKMILIATL